LRRDAIIDIPIYGSIAAGFAELSEQQNEGVVSVDVRTAGVRRGARMFALKVRGDSMIDDGIHDGDVVIVETRRDAANGATVVAVVGGEATVKRFYRRRGRIHLVPANERMEPIVAREEDVELRGVVVALLRRYK
jgi:repressor LexA